jgi:hypothetical protein
MKKSMAENKRSIYLSFVVIVLGLICISSSEYPDITPTKNQVSTQTRPIATATLLPQIMPTPTLPFRVDSTCWRIKPLQAGNDIPGSLILANISEGVDRFYYWDLSSFHVKPITWTSESDTPLVTITADSNFLLSVTSTGNDSARLTLKSPSKTLFADLQQGASYSFMYLAGGKILAAAETNRDINSENYKEESGFTDVFYIFDPITSELLSHSVFLPNFKPLPPICNGFGCGAGFQSPFLINYSPDGRYVLYHSAQEGKEGFSLLDISHNKVLWTMPEPNYYWYTKFFGNQSNIPIWKPDSSSLIYNWRENTDVFNPDFYSISVDGSIAKMAEFTNLFGDSYSPWKQPQWSPDLRYMTFDIDQDLYIWDTNEKILLKPCFPTDIVDALPEWSFDSKHLEFATPQEETYKSDKGTVTITYYRYLIYDVPNRTIFKLPNIYNQDIRENLKLPGEPYEAEGIGGLVNWEIP